MNPPRSAFGAPPQGGAASGPAEPDPRRLLDRGGALQEAVALADAAGSVREAAAALRLRFAGLRVVVVDAFDMRSETPAAIGTKRQLYLGASDGHCWSVTTDAGEAAAFFIAERP